MTMESETVKRAATRRSFGIGLASTAGLGLTAAAAGPANAGPPPLPARPRPAENSGHFVDVTLVDRRIVRRRIVASETYDPQVAAANSRAIREILTSSKIEDGCVVYFPAGRYYFGDAAGDWASVMRTTRARMTFLGDGVNGTTLYVGSRSADALISIEHDACSVESLSIFSADRSESYEPKWTTKPHRAAIQIVADSSRWWTDPKILDVNVNSEGNNIVLRSFFRPFLYAVRIVGPWLNVYAHTMFIQHVFTAIDIDQGSRIAGPAKFIDVNFYATDQTHFKEWTKFFSSQSRLMEQVELIHCTFIGSQFVYMNGLPDENDSFTPAYNMVIDHNYINTTWVPTPDPTDYSKSGIYLRLPPASDGANHSRDIRFTGNSCTAGLPDRPAFFYVEGVCRGVVFAHNDVSSGAMNKCVYIRGAERFGDEDVSVRDVKVFNNYFRNFGRPIIIGGDAADPSGAGKDDDPFVTDRVLVHGNHSLNEPGVAKMTAVGIMLNRCRKAVVADNSLFDVAHTGISVANCQATSVAENQVGSFDDTAGDGILVKNADGVSVLGNSTAGFQNGIRVVGGSDVTMATNVVDGAVESGVLVDDISGFALAGNIVAGGAVGLRVGQVKAGTFTGNVCKGSGERVEWGSLEDVAITGNVCEGPDTTPSGTRVVATGNVGIADVS